MIRRVFLFSIFAVSGTFCASHSAHKPKLVLVISLDQFRYDYLTRFSSYFGNRGFNLFLRDGANFVNTHYLHSTTSTAPGHAVILSGTYGNVNGIIANGWFDGKLNKEEYCVADEAVATVGAHGDCWMKS